jgi:uncharacterized protein (TIGR00299 family) protein
LRDVRIAYFDCFSGISGDMALGALVDAGASLGDLTAELGKLDLEGYHIEAAKVVKRGISATDVTVKLQGGREPTRGFAEIRGIIEASELKEGVKERSVAIFRRLGEAEAKIHGKDIEEIHFHEVGAVDAIVDIVGVCICLDLLGVEQVHASAIPTFHGSVKIDHGTLPLPAPATIELLKGAPWRELGIEGEIVTPTGAAILAELACSFGPMPAMRVESIGYGSGKKDFGIPNVLRVTVGEGLPPFPGEGGEEVEEVAVLETNIDDMNPQVYDVVMERLFEAGALDVYLSPIQMKKNRPAVLVSVMCAPEDTGRMSDILFEETSTIGIRIDRRTRACLAREFVTVETRFGPIRVKVARKGEEVVNAQPEYDDCRAAATAREVPVKLVRDTALAVFLTSQ